MNERFDLFETKLVSDFKDILQTKVNRLGEEIASDINLLESKIKELASNSTQQHIVAKEAMLTLEQKFDRAWEKKPVTTLIQQKVNYT